MGLKLGDQPVITLLGEAEIVAEAGTPYQDSGATASDTEDGDLTDALAIQNPVDPGVIGDYLVTYDVTDSWGRAAEQVTRSVLVRDTIKPIIALNGPSIVTLAVGDSYQESGAVVTDFETDLVVSITGFLNTSQAGNYILAYDVTDSSGNVAETAVRTIVVEDSGPPS